MTPRHANNVRLDAAILVVAALVLLALAYERGAMSEARKPSVYSTYDTGANGFRALYDVLAAAGLPVRRFQRELPLLDASVRTLVITGYETDPSRNPLDEHDAAFLRTFVSNGGRLVAIDEEFAGRDDIAPGVGTTHRASGGGDAIALTRGAYTAGVSRMRGTIGWIFPFSEPPGVPLLANANGIAAMLYRVGRGEVIAVTAPALFGNAQLQNADNARFAYNAVANHGAIAFDEYVHGYNDGLTMWAALPAPVHAAIWLAVALLAIALVGANVPFAPPLVPEAADERDSSHYITALAELMRRSRRRPRDDDVLGQTRAALSGVNAKRGKSGA